MNLLADGDVERDVDRGEGFTGAQIDQPVGACQRQHIGFTLSQFGEHQVGFQPRLVKVGSAHLFAAATKVVGHHVADITAPVYGPTNYFWQYTNNPATNFYGADIGGAEREPNGDTLITFGIRGTLFEVTSNLQTIWQYVNPVTATPLAQGSAMAFGLATVTRAQTFAPGTPNWFASGNANAGFAVFWRESHGCKRVVAVRLLPPCWRGDYENA